MSAVRLLTLDPGHFHAALVQKEMYPGVAPQVQEALGQARTGIPYRHASPDTSLRKDRAQAEPR